MRYLAGILVLTSLALPAWADSISMASGLNYDKVTVTDAGNGGVTFQTGSGAGVSKLVREVGQITLAGDDAFNKAEGLLAQKKFAEAAAAYAGSSRTGWKKTLASQRRLQALDGAGKFDEAVALWLELVDAANGARGALGLKPANMPAKESKLLANVETALKARLEKTGPADVTAVARQMLVDVYERQGKLEEASALQQRIVASNPGTVANPTATPSAAATAAQLKIARLAVDGGKFKEALAAVNPIMEQVSAADLPEALYILGRGQVASVPDQAEPAESSPVLVEAALNLMRVVGSYPAHERAADCLYWAAVANERLGHQRAAQTAYAAVVSRYAKSPVAKDAAAAVERLKKESAPSSRPASGPGTVN